LHRANYQKDSRKLSLQCINVKGKHVVEKWVSEIEIENANPNDVMKLHQETDEALAHTVDDQ
jgi:aspartyl/asparaginyl-tRNA synthetase